MRKNAQLIGVIFFILCYFAPVVLARNYTYDSLNRLTSIVYNNGDAISYTYDDAGNLKETVASVSTTPAITIISPNGGETWQAGSSQRIRWNSTGPVDSTVKIELYKGSSLNRTIISGTPNTGVYTWSLPSNLTSASNYRIKITPTAYPAYAEFSNSNFAVTSTAGVLSTVTINGASEVFESTVSNYSATAAYSDGSTANITASASWNENSTSAIINAGKLTTSAVSTDMTVTLTASFTHSGTTKTAEKNITIRKKDLIRHLTSLTINGASSLPENSTEVYTATARFSDGLVKTVTDLAIWNENSPYASLDNGTLTTEDVSANSAVTLSASYTYSGRTEQTQKTVTITDNNTQVSLISLSISGSATVQENSSASYTATAYFSDNSNSNVTGAAAWGENSPFTVITQNGLLSTGTVDQNKTVTVFASFGTNGVTKQTSKNVTILDNDAVSRPSIVPILYLLFSGSSPEPASDTVMYNGLMWQKTDDGVFRDWWEAGTYCENLQLGGYTDWRLPTFDELNGLIVCSNGAPTPPPKFSFLGCRDAVGDFNTPTMDPVFDAAYITSPYIGYGIYWTSTENGTQTDYAWIISFNYGQNAASEKFEDSLYIVRCVRDF